MSVDAVVAALRAPASRTPAELMALADAATSGEAAELRADLYEAASRELVRIGDADAAMEALDRAVAAGWREVPDVRVRCAELHLLAGRDDRCAEVLDAVRREQPDDVWLYNNAALAFGDLGRHQEALDWLAPGLELALEQGDPERLVPQLADLRRRSLDALGRPPDALQERAERYARREPARRAPAVRPRDPAVHVALAWFPPGELQRALTTWPELADEWGGTSDEDYAHALEARIKRFAAEGVAMRAVAPIRLDAYLAWCAERGDAPATAASRAAYAADLLRRGQAIPWPPGRNDACWCGSGRKYKRCCGPVPAAAAPPGA